MSDKHRPWNSTTVQNSSAESGRTVRETASETLPGTPNNPTVLIQRIRAASASRPVTPAAVESRLPKLSDVRAVLFDVYGTLFISGSGDIGTAMDKGRDDVFADAFLEALSHIAGDNSSSRDVSGDVSGLPAGLGEAAREAYFSTIAELHEQSMAAGVEAPEVDVREVWRIACRRPPLCRYLKRLPGAAEIEELALAYELRANPVWPMPAARSTLLELAARGYRLGLVSNAQFFTPLLFPALMAAELGELGIDPQLCAFSFREGHAKPSPMIFRGPLSGLRERDGIVPREVLYVGNDMRNDIAAAAVAGCRTCLFAGDARSLRLRHADSALAGIQPEAIIRSLPELLSVLPVQGGTFHA